jgi:hypothetical protein
MKRAPYREAIVSKFPFLIIFELQEESILVYSVFNLDYALEFVTSPPSARKSGTLEIEA